MGAEARTDPGAGADIAVFLWAPSGIGVVSENWDDTGVVPWVGKGAEFGSEDTAEVAGEAEPLACLP